MSDRLSRLRPLVIVIAAKKEPSGTRQTLEFPEEKTCVVRSGAPIERTRRHRANPQSRNMYSSAKNGDHDLGGDAPEVSKNPQKA